MVFSMRHEFCFSLSFFVSFFFFFVEGRIVEILLLVESNGNEERLKGGKYRWQVGNRF